MSLYTGKDGSARVGYYLPKGKQLEIHYHLLYQYGKTRNNKITN